LLIRTNAVAVAALVLDPAIVGVAGTIMVVASVLIAAGRIVAGAVASAGAYCDGMDQPPSAR